MRRRRWCAAWQNGRVMSRGTPRKPSGRRRAAGRPRLPLAVPLLVAGLAAGCSVPAPVVTGSNPVSSPTPSNSVTAIPGTGTPSASASPNPGVGNSPNPGTAQLKQTMESALKTLAAANPKPAQEALRTQLVSAGIPDSTLEVSASKTPTGLDVDSIEAAARLDKDCVMGEIRDGQVSVSVLPALATGKCFVGDSR